MRGASATSHADTCATHPDSDPAAPVHAWADAINNGDAEAALALVSDDVKWQGSFEATGKEQFAR